MDVRIRHALLFPATFKDIYLLCRGKFDIYFIYYAYYNNAEHTISGQNCDN